MALALAVALGATLALVGVVARVAEGRHPLHDLAAVAAAPTALAR